MNIEEISQKQTRRKAIWQLIKTCPISDQKQLVELLLHKYNLETNQTVVSRDLRKLGIVKKSVAGELLYEVPSSNIHEEILRLALVDISYNECMIVIKTQPALADFVGDYLDEQTELDILGCVSGENTLLVTPKSIVNIKQTYEQLCEALFFKKKYPGEEI